MTRIQNLSKTTNYKFGCYLTFRMCSTHHVHLHNVVFILYNIESSSSSTHTPASNSKRMREEGNAFFRQAQRDDDIELKRSGMKKALRCYRDALSSATNDDEAASAAKNAAYTSFHLATSRQKMADADKVINILQNSFNEQITYANQSPVKYLKKRILLKITQLLKYRQCNKWRHSNN